MGLIRSRQLALSPEQDEELTGALWPVVRELFDDLWLILEGKKILSLRMH